MRRVLWIGAATAVGLAVAPANAETSAAEIEAAVLGAVNAYRAAEGLPVLAREEAVAEIARRHSEAMAGGEVPFGHDGMRERFETLAEELGISRFAENVSRSERPRADVSAAAVGGWLESRRHRRNIRGDYRLSGMGAAVDAEGVVFLTQIFVAR